ITFHHCSFRFRSEECLIVCSGGHRGRCSSTSVLRRFVATSSEVLSCFDRLGGVLILHLRRMFCVKSFKVI
ncbi:hypothetical protein NDU88_002868, partial [Pleurodeles waltl]